MLYQKCFFTWVLGLMLFQSTSYAQENKPEIKSIFIDYGYENVSVDDPVGQLMFAKTHYSAYGDDRFFLIRKYAVNPTPKSMDVITVEIIKDLKAGKSYSCLTFGNKKFRQEETGENDLASNIFGPYNDPAFIMKQTSSPAVTIQGAACETVELSIEGNVAATLYLTQAFIPVGALKDMPLFVQHDGKILGLCLGNDANMGNTYQLRAQKIEVDKPQNIAEHLATFKDASQAEINAEIKALLGF